MTSKAICGQILIVEFAGKENAGLENEISCPSNSSPPISSPANSSHPPNFTIFIQKYEVS